MGRKSRLKKLRRDNREKFSSDFNPDQLPMWQDMEGLHAITPGHPPSEEKLAEMTAVYQKNIRNSEIFTLMVKQFGKEKAEEMLKEFKVEIRS
jgi:hypothetical protein